MLYRGECDRQQLALKPVCTTGGLRTILQMIHAASTTKQRYDKTDVAIVGCKTMTRVTVDMIKRAPTPAHMSDQRKLCCDWRSALL